MPNRKVGLKNVQLRTANWTKGAEIKVAYGDLEKDTPKNCFRKTKIVFACGEKMAQQKLSPAANKVGRPKYVLRCAQPASRRLMRKTFFDPYVARVRQRNS